MEQPFSPAKQRLVDAAADLLRETGYDGFSLRKLGARTGLSAPALYMHFADKDALLRAVMDQEFAQAAGPWLAAHPLPPGAGPREALYRLVEFYLHMGLSNPVSYRIRFFHDRGADAQIAAWARGSFAPGDNAAVLKGALDAWLAADGAAPDPAWFVETWALLHGLILALAPAPGDLADKTAFALAACRRHLEALHAALRG